ncbi:hypothetical protein ACOSQ3_008240 [Xanthoceras sorbifolium]
MNRDMGLFLGGLIGAVQEIDGGDSGDCLGKFLRVRVLINVQQPLKRGLRFAFGAGGEVCSALLCYERLPNFFLSCVEGKVSEEMNMGLSRVFTGDERKQKQKREERVTERKGEKREKKKKEKKKEEEERKEKKKRKKRKKEKGKGKENEIVEPRFVERKIRIRGRCTLFFFRNQLVRCSFLPKEAEIILSIQLSSVSCQDSLLWHYDKRGEFTVRSAYKLAAEAFGKNFGSPSAGPDPWWKALWSLHIPSKVKFFGWKVCKNILPTRGCLKSRKVLELDACPLCGACSESIDHILWSCVKVLLSPCLWSRASAYFSDFQSATTSGLSISSSPKHLWSRPPDGAFKLNVDASVVSGLGCFGVGLIFRDDSGFPVLVKSQLFSGSISVEVAEARAVLEGVSLAVDQRETDSCCCCCCGI